MPQRRPRVGDMAAQRLANANGHCMTPAMRAVLAQYLKWASPDANIAGDHLRARRALEVPPRMRETLDCLRAGLSEKQIAAQLGISRHTVHVYIKRLYKRYGVNSRGELFAWFLDER